MCQVTRKFLLLMLIALNTSFNMLEICLIPPAYLPVVCTKCLVKGQRQCFFLPSFSSLGTLSVRENGSISSLVKSYQATRLPASPLKGLIKLAFQHYPKPFLEIDITPDSIWFSGSIFPLQRERHLVFASETSPVF